MKKLISTIILSLVTSAALANSGPSPDEVRPLTASEAAVLLEADKKKIEVKEFPRRVWVVNNVAFIVPVTPENYPLTTYQERKQLREYLEGKRKNKEIEEYVDRRMLEEYDNKVNVKDINLEGKGDDPKAKVKKQLEGVDIIKVPKDLNEPVEIQVNLVMDEMRQAAASQPTQPKVPENNTAPTIDIKLDPKQFNVEEGVVVENEGANVPVGRQVKSHIQNSQVQCLARAMYYEARGESEAGKLAVGNVIINRAMFKGYFPNTICGVIAERGQFQWYHNAKLRGNKPFNPRQHNDLMVLAKRLIDSHNAGKRVDNSRNSYFFSSNGVIPAPSAVRRTRVGNHTFFALRESWINKRFAKVKRSRRIS